MAGKGHSTETHEKNGEKQFRCASYLRKHIQFHLNPLPFATAVRLMLSELVEAFDIELLRAKTLLDVCLLLTLAEHRAGQTSARQLQRKTLLSRWKATVAWSGSALSVSNMAEKLATAAQ